MITTMLSQSQLHFIYNTLSAINDMCDENPEAQKALVAFSEYLRVTMDSVNQKTTVPFETELKYIKHYLSLEKLRYEDKLNVIYDMLDMVPSAINAYCGEYLANYS